MLVETAPQALDVTGSSVARWHGAPEAGRVDVWIGCIPDWLEVPKLPIYIIDGEERRRALAFARTLHCSRFLVAHIGLRAILGAYLGVHARRVELTREPCPMCGQPHGRPAVKARPPLQFSMSHSGEVVLYAMAGEPVGVDVETGAAGDPASLRSCLHPAEGAALEAVPPERRRDALLGCWVRKEAYLKGLGVGLAVQLARVHVGLGSHFSTAKADAHATPDGWALAEVKVPGAQAAVALATGIDGPPLRIRARQVDLPALVASLA